MAKEVIYNWRTNTNYAIIIRDLVNYRRVCQTNGKKVSRTLMKAHKVRMSDRAYKDFDKSVERGRKAIVGGWWLSRIDNPTRVLSIPNDSLAHLRLSTDDGVTCVYCLHAIE